MKKIIRLTESDIHRIVKNSVKRILKESVLDDYDNAEQRLRAARAAGNTKEIIAAAREWNRLKDLAKNDIEARKKQRDAESEQNYSNWKRQKLQSTLKTANDLIDFFKSSAGLYQDTNVGGIYKPLKHPNYDKNKQNLSTKVEEAKDLIFDLKNELYNCDNNIKGAVQDVIRRLSEIVSDYSE